MKARFLALAALVLGLAACQTEPEGLDVNVGGAVDTTITVSLPETTRATNSALGAFGNVDLNGTNGTDYTVRYIFEVYYGDTGTQKQVYYTDGKNASFPVRLVPNRHYNFVAWADIVEQPADDKMNKALPYEDTDVYYETSDLTDITIIDSEWVAMDEKRDAFTGYFNTAYDGDKKPYNGSKSINIKLTRPFAKLRVITTDMVELGNLGITPVSAKVTYTAFSHESFNALDGTYSDTAVEKTHTYTIADYADQTGANKVLFTDFFFADGNDVVKFQLDVHEKGVNEQNETTRIKLNDFTTDIPVKRNNLTTISGNILTDGNNIKVEVENDGKFEGEIEEKIVEVGNATDLQEAIDNSTEETTIVLGGDIVLGDGIITFAATRAGEPTYGLLIPANKEVVLDLKGYTISQSKEQTGAYAMIDNKGILTIEDSSANKSGKIAYGDNGNGGNYVSNTISNSGVLTINGGIIENNSSATVASNGFPHPIDNSGVLTINGGKFTNNANYSSMRIWCTTDDDTIVTINGGTFNGSIDFQTPNTAANKGTLTINGGTFNADTYTNCSVRLLGFGADVDEMNGYIKGGHFNGAIALKNWSGSELNSKVFDITGGTFTVDPSEFVDGDYSVVENNGVYSLELKDVIAKIGEVEYRSLQKAVEDVEDGDTIILVANEVFTKNNRYNNGGWWDGLGYSGDKSFTIDLGNFTISQNGALNDYLIWVKNVGSKANTITIKNGTLDAGTTAYCALCTASSHDNQLTINLENITLINKISNGSTVKVRAGSVVNVKAGTKIIGKDSYLGIENWNATVNVYDGAEIYMNGTSSYNGCLIGVGGNGIVNVYGGYGKGVSGGLIAMTSGGTINVSGGEWIANTDGTYANSNKSVLVAQSDKQYNAGAGNAIVNVTGGTFKGGYNCYGNAVGDAQINIKGGNFNANPASYVVAGYESVEENGIWTVGKPQALVEFEAAIANGGNVKLAADITLLESVVIEGKTVVLDLNGKTVTAPSISAFTVKTDGKLTLKNGNVVAHASVVSAQGGEVVIESGYYTETGDYYSNPSTLRYCVDARDGGKITINGGEFNTTNGMFNVNSGCQIEVNGGKFTSSINNAATRHFAYVGGQLTINDGEFLGKANGAAGGCFFCGAGADGDIQVNGGKFTSLWTSGSVNRIFEVYFGGTINVTGGMFNTNGGIATFVTENTDEATKAAYPYVAK